MISHQNNICVLCKQERIIIEDYDKFKALSNPFKDYTISYANEISNNYNKLQINRSNSNVDNDHIGQLISLLETNIKCDTNNSFITFQPESKLKKIELSKCHFPENISIPSNDEQLHNEEYINPKNEENKIMTKNMQCTLYNNALLYLKSCHKCLKELNIPDKCIIGAVYNIHDIYNNIIPLINDSGKIPISIQKLTNDISSINDSLNNIINFFNILKSAQVKILTFFERSLYLLDKLNAQKFIVNSEKEKIDLKKGQLISILIDYNQNPIFVFDKRSNIGSQNPIDDFFKLFIFCVREFQRKTNLDAFIFKYYERRINNNNNNNNNNDIYLDDFIKKKFNSFTDPLLQSCKNFVLPIMNSLRNEICEKIKTYKIFPNEEIPTIDIYESKCLDNLKILNQIGKNHLQTNKKTIYNLIKSIFDQIFNDEVELPTENEEEQQILKQKKKILNSYQGIFIKLIDEYRLKNEHYFINELLRNVIKKLLLKEDITKKSNDNMEPFDIVRNDLNDQYPYGTTHKLFFDNFNFVLKKKYQMRNEIVEREKSILKKNYSKFIVNCIVHEDSIDIPYFPYNTLFSIINQHKIKSFSYVDRIIIIIEIATALYDLHINDEYHGNLSCQSILINSSKDAYIGSFAYDRKCEQNLSQSPVQTYYRSPEDNSGKQEENIQNYKLNDIYSFGILVYSILTGISPMQKMKGLTRSEKGEKFQNNYFEYLLENGGGLVFEEDSFDSKGNSLIGFKNIIEKCMKKEPNERYQRFDEILEYIKKTSIYTKNIEEIEYRFNHATKACDYQCHISDLVENYYNGNVDSLIIIEKALNTCCNAKEKISDKENVTKYILDTIKVKPSNNQLSIMKYLISLFIQNDENNIEKKYNANECTDSFWLILINKLKYNLFNDNDDNNIVSILDSIFQFFIYNIGNEAQNDFFKSYFYLTDTEDQEEQNKLVNWKDFLYLIQQNRNNTNKDKKSLIETFKKKLNEFKNKNYFLDLIFHVAVRSILDQRLFSEKFHELLNSTHNNIELHYVKDSLSFNEIDSSYKLYVDNDFNFVLQKTYNQNIKKYIRDREKNIMKENYSKFVVHCEDDCQENKIIIPYFPCGNLDSLIRKQSQKSPSHKIIELTNIDKIVIALEIAIALKDLHSNNEYHGNLASQFIFITSTKDAYIGGIAYDRKLEIDSTKPRGPFYYRPPEITYFVYTDQQDENIREQKLYDIYSYGVLIHELFTEYSPERRMGNKSRDERLHLLKDLYDEFLLSGVNDDFFDEDSYDINGNNLFGFKEVIANCIKKESKDRYQMVDLIIDDIKKLPIYINNKEEIEYRIENATCSTDYQCTISDIVESYYLGNENSLYDIEKALSLYLKLSSDENFLSFHIKDDLIKSIFERFTIKYKIPENDLNSLDKQLDGIVKKHINIKIEDIQSNDQLLNLSYTENHNNNENFIIPISSLDKFIQQNHDYKEYAKMWAYFISNELTMIHSKNLFHGDLSLKSIGIYYNEKTKTFIPSIILYYLIFKQNNKGEKTKSSNESQNDFIDRMQKKDIKNAIKIISELIGENEKFEDLIDGDVSLYTVTYFLYNFNINNNTNDTIFKENLNYSKSLFRISFLIIGEILKQAEENSFLIDDSFISFTSIFEEIIEYLDNELKKNPNKYNEHILFNKIDFQHHGIVSLKDQYKYVYDKCENYILFK